ncbi:MAG: beta-carotene 15,15'-monooxygenase [Chloroflexi bacterium]|nr:MAG: beta-carotene 15,15'-monooxygenase [Chloroflexota bacterium]
MSNRPFELGFGESERELTIDSLPVQGNMPTWLTGTLVRNGPGTFRVGGQRYRHWFDGLAMLHKFSFATGRVSYANKFIRGKAYQAAQENGRIAYNEFATDPCRSLFERITAVFSPKTTDNAKVSIARIANQFMALGETPIQVSFDLDTLEMAGVFQYEDNPVGQMTTVHPHFDDDTTYNMVTRYNRISQYRLYGIDAKANAKMIGQVPTHQPAYMHSFGMSQNYVILTEFPFVVNPLNLLLWIRPFIENFRWKPKRGTPFYVMNRFTGELVARFEADPFFAFHHINAFELGNELIVDINAYEDASIIEAFYLNRLAETSIKIPFGTIRRYRLPLTGAKMVRYETITDECVELARYDYGRFHTNPNYQHVYACSINRQQRQGFYNQLIKINVKTGVTKTWYEADTYPGEPIFVGAPDRSSEDDGVVLSVVLDAAKGNSFLLVLDAKTFVEIARAEIPQAVLFGYHGEFFYGTNH